MFGTIKIIENKKIKKIILDGKYLSHFKKIYSEKISSDATDYITRNAIKIFDKISDINAFPNLKKGIVFGKVQSGKTSNFLCLLSLVFDNNYNVAIILGGSDTELLSQNSERINEVFKFETTNEITLSAMDNFAGYSSTDIEQFIKKGRKLIITVMKNKTHLEKLQKFFENSIFLKKSNILIIDDEGDQASLDSNFNTKKEEPTKIHKLILEIINNLGSYSYICVTATPYANLLIPTLNFLSPDFISLINPNEDYKGLQDFHGENSGKFIRILHENEEENIFKNFLPTKTKTFKIALSCFFLGSSLKELKTDKENSKAEMLVHCKKQKKFHLELNNDIISQINNWKKKMNLSEDNIEYQEFIDFIDYGFSDYFNRKYDKNNSNDQKILKVIIEKIDNTEVRVINSSKEFKDKRNKLILYPNIIYIGADLLQRGITLKNLLITFITRRAVKKTNADTTLQRARWFGYRNNYIQYMRIFCTQKINDDFQDILDADEKLWFDLELLNNNEIPLNEWVRWIEISNSNISPTRNNVAKFKFKSLPKWNTQNFLHDTKEQEFITFNKLLQKSIERKYHEATHKEIVYKDWKDWKKDFNGVIYFILNKCGIDDYPNLEEIIIDNNMPVKVIFMRSGQKSKRTQKHKNWIQFFSGQRESQINNKYWGDRKIPLYAENKGRYIILEIYYFEISNQKKIIQDSDSLFYALYIPGNEGGGYVNQHEHEQNKYRGITI